MRLARIAPLSLASLLALAALAPPARAQASLEYGGAVLGDALHAHVSGPPFHAFGVAPSLGLGPTPLALFDPSDPRSLDVGLDLAPLWKAGVLGASGHGSIAYPLPSEPALAGLVVHVQAVTAPGAATLIDEITNAVQVELALPGAAIATLSAPLAARRMHRGTPLDDGRLLLTGGAKPGPFGGPPTFLAGAEVFDPQTGGFEGPHPIGAPRALHTATPLADGRVLLLGGVTTGSSVLASGVIFDPATRTTTPVPSMASPRVLHSATLLASGKVLVVGGSAAYDAQHPIGHAAGAPPAGSLGKPAARQTQLFDPATGQWSDGPLLPHGLTAHQAVRLDDGRVLIAGGFAFPAAGAPHATAQAFLYLPALNALSPAAPLSKPVAFHSAVKTRYGDVILAGGGAPDVAAAKFTPIDRSFLYDASAAAFLDKPPVPTPPGIAGGIVTPGGETICLCSRPGMPTGGPLGAFLGDCLPSAPTTYAMIVDTVLLNLGTGATAPAGTIHTTQGSIGAWKLAGTFQSDRNRPAIAPQGDGARVLISGGETAGGPSAELWIVLY